MSVKVNWLDKVTESYQNKGDKGFENYRTLLKWSKSKTSFVSEEKVTKLTPF